MKKKINQLDKKSPSLPKELKEGSKVSIIERAEGVIVGSGTIYRITLLGFFIEGKLGDVAFREWFPFKRFIFN